MSYWPNSYAASNLDSVPNPSTKEDEFPRYRFVSDDDGHNYIIPAGMQKQFDRWLESRWLESCQDDAPPYSGFVFDDYRINSPSNYTFTNPREDE